jgi:DedD protein
MGLFSFLQRKKPPVPDTRKRTPPPQDPVTVEALRTRARRRLIGAAVLVGGAVIGLPTLFDQPPRPADQSFNVRLAAADGAAAVSVKAPTAAGSAALVRPGGTEVAPSAGVSGTAVAVAAAGTAAAVGLLPGTGRKPPADDTIITETKADLEADKRRAEKVRADKEKEKEKEKARAERARAEKLKAEKAQEAEQAREAEKARQERAARKAKEAKAAKEAKEAKAAKSDSEDDKPRRYVIQAGSFSEASAARDLGRRIDKLGLDSHEQHVETAAGSARTRVRLGPFKTKEEALRAAARLKAAGLNAAVLPL